MAPTIPKLIKILYNKRIERYTMKTPLPAAALLCAALLLPATNAFADNEDMPLPGDVQTAPAVQHHLNTHGKKLATPKAEGSSRKAKRHTSRANGHRHTLAAKGKKPHVAKKVHARKKIHGKAHKTGKPRRHSKKH